MNKKNRNKLIASLNQAMQPPGNKPFAPLPANSNLSKRELTDRLLENYSDVKSVSKSKREIEKRKGGERISQTNENSERSKTELSESERPSKKLFSEALKQIKGGAKPQIIITETRTPGKVIPNLPDFQKREFVHPIEEFNDPLSIYNIFSSIRVKVNDFSKEVTGQYLDREQMPEILELAELLIAEIRQAAAKESEPIENLPAFALEHFKQKLSSNK